MKTINIIILWMIVLIFSILIKPLDIYRYTGAVACIILVNILGYIEGKLEDRNKI